MRQKILQPEHTIGSAKPRDAAHHGHAPPQDLRAFLCYAQAAHGNRAVGRLLQTVTNTACPCGSSGGLAEQCEECQSKTVAADVVSTKGPATRSIMSDGDTETLTVHDGGDCSSSGKAAQATTTIDGGSGCSALGTFSSIPKNTTLVASLTGSKLHRAFSMIGAFAPSIPCTCSCGEYRQFVRGTFTKNGSSVTHPLCGTNLDPTTFQEDCGIVGGTSYHYGYRSQPFATSKFTPDQAGGCTFEGIDDPGILGASGDILAMNLDFKGQLIDTCNGNNILDSAEWSVGGTAAVP